MKELSIEEKAKAYDEALEKMKEIITMDNNPTIPKEIGEHLFPELKESEEEKIRKEIIKYIEGTFPNEFSGIKSKNKWIAWLEKQDEQKPAIEMKTAEESLGVSSDEYNKIVDECIYGNDKTADKVESFDYEGLTDFERTLTDVCTGWIGRELGWKQYIKDNADVLLKIAFKLWNSVQDVQFEQNTAWSEEDDSHLLNCIVYFGGIKESSSYYEDYLWLKSLKDRVVPQKYELSEKDKYYQKFIVGLLYGLEDDDMDYVSKCRKAGFWLNNILRK